MNDISSTQRKASLTPSPSPQSIPKKSDVADFARSLRRLEEESQPDNPTVANASMPNQATLLSPLGSDNSAINDVAMEAITGVGLVASEEQTAQLNAPVTNLLETASNQEQQLDHYVFDAVLDTALPQWLSPPDLAASERMLNGSTLMTLNDFTSLLEQGWTPKSANGSQVWGFTLHDTAFPLTRIVLKNDRAANGYWSVALTVNGEDNLALSQHLQQLRTRLEKLGNSISHVALADEE